MLLSEYIVIRDGKTFRDKEAAGTAALLNRISVSRTGVPPVIPNLIIAFLDTLSPRERAARRDACVSFASIVTRG
jgi:hypothetical protein